MVWICSQIILLCSDFMLLNGVYRIFGVYFDRSQVDRRLEIVAFIVCYLINSLNYRLIGIPLVSTIVTTASVLALTAIYHGKILGKIIRGLSVIALMMICEGIVYGLTVSLHLMQFGNTVFMTAGSLVSHLAFFSISLMIKQFYTPGMTPRISVLYWFAILTLPISSMILLLVISVEYTHISSITLLIFYSVVLLVNLMTFYVLDQLEKYSAAFYEKQILERQNAAYRAEFALMQQSEQQVRALRHDMKNHLVVLEQYAEQGKIEELESYLKSCTEKLNKPGYVNTGNQEIDSILNYKLEQAGRLGVKPEIHIALPEQFTVDVFDLNVILGNLLDNAVEALERCDEKRLSLSLRVDRGVLYFKIINSYDGIAYCKTDQQGIRYQSRKEGKGHGLGLQIVQKTVEKYHGQLRIDRGNTEFTVSAILYLNE